MRGVYIFELNASRLVFMLTDLSMNEKVQFNLENQESNEKMIFLSKEVNCILMSHNLNDSIL